MFNSKPEGPFKAPSFNKFLLRLSASFIDVVLSCLTKSKLAFLVLSISVERLIIVLTIISLKSFTCVFKEFFLLSERLSKSSILLPFGMP